MLFFLSFYFYVRKNNHLWHSLIQAGCNSLPRKLCFSLLSIRSIDETSSNISASGLYSVLLIIFILFNRALLSLSHQKQSLSPPQSIQLHGSLHPWSPGLLIGFSSSQGSFPMFYTNPGVSTVSNLMFLPSLLSKLSFPSSQCCLPANGSAHWGSVPNPAASNESHSEEEIADCDRAYPTLSHSAGEQGSNCRCLCLPNCLTLWLLTTESKYRSTKTPISRIPHISMWVELWYTEKCFSPQRWWKEKAQLQEIKSWVNSKALK